MRLKCITALPTGQYLFAYVLVIWYTHYSFLACCWNKLFVRMFLVVGFIHCATKSVPWKNKGSSHSPKFCPSEATLPHANDRGSGPYCYMRPSTSSSLTVGTKTGCSRNCQRPSAWHKHCPLFPLFIALIDRNFLKPLSLSLSLSLYIYIYIYIYTADIRSSHILHFHLHKMQSAWRQIQYIPSTVLEQNR